jgi:hypothetical protein
MHVHIALSQAKERRKSGKNFHGSGVGEITTLENVPKNWYNGVNNITHIAKAMLNRKQSDHIILLEEMALSLPS